MSNEKVIDKIRKLIAKSVSTTFEAEKASFAVEAVRLIHVHGIHLGDPPPPKPEPARRPRARPAPAAPIWTPRRTTWEPRTAQRDGFCAICHSPYYRGDPVWFWEGRGTIHIEWPEPPCSDGTWR